MRRIINSTYISLDGVIQNPQDWPSRDVIDDAGFTTQYDLLQSCDALLLGRHTYDAFASVWMAQSDDPYTDQINGMTKYLVSSTVDNPAWHNTTVISGDPIAEIKRIKEQPGRNIVQYGFGRLAYALMEHGLLDELRLWVHPFFVGRGGPADLLYRDSALTTFDLVGTTTFKTGIVVLTYRATPPVNS